MGKTCSDQAIGTPGTHGFQADCAGSIPVTRSTAVSRDTTHECPATPQTFARLQGCPNSRPPETQPPSDLVRDTLANGMATATMTHVFALPALFAALPGLARCGCCGGVYPRRRVRHLAATPGVFICRDCARSAAEHTGGRRR